MPKTRVYVTVDRALLDELKQAAGKNLNLSVLASDALRYEIRRIRHQALLDELDRERTLSTEDDTPEELLSQAAGSPGVPALSRVESLRLLASVRGVTRVIDISDPASWSPATPREMRP